MGGTWARACLTEVLGEQACVRNHDQGKPLGIVLLQYFAVDDLLENTQQHPFVRAPETGKQIAVIGAGPPEPRTFRLTRDCAHVYGV
jgi:glutamate synthase (NADPH/NADH) small chain